MILQKTCLDYGIKIGKLPRGKLNKITDVEGITVGHVTLDTSTHKTGVTAIVPSNKNIFKNKLVCACNIINGFGKSLGTMQLSELGTLETPILITNTLNVGLVHDAVISYMQELCQKDNIKVQSINPIICECNDGYLNDISERVIKKEQVYSALNNATRDFLQGDIGAGKGMSCHGLKGGIGSSSRIVSLNGKDYTVGMLVLSNYGLLDDLTIQGINIGIDIAKNIDNANITDKGSIAMIIATDIPMSYRQLNRISKRPVIGLARLGSYIGHESGEIVISFSTANTINIDDESEIKDIKIIKEESIDKVFRAVAECCEEAVINSMICSNQVVGYNNHIRRSLRDFIFNN